ncbi:MAG: hypothetical protein M9887_04925 [Chitinophagales bacterium]|nr:hypothetical protein [Chitinophagales bacterium]
MKRILSLCVIAASLMALLNACKYPDIPKHIEIIDQLKLDYAPYLKKAPELYPNAAIGLQNKYRDVYYFITYHPWKEDSNYVKVLYDSLANDLKNVKKLDNGLQEVLVMRDTAYHNTRGYYVQDLLISGVLKERKLIYDMQLIQKDSFLFQTAGWCFLEKKDLWMKDIDAMNESLEILHPVR